MREGWYTGSFSHMQVWSIGGVCTVDILELDSNYFVMPW